MCDYEPRNQVIPKNNDLAFGYTRRHQSGMILPWLGFWNLVLVSAPLHLRKHHLNLVKPVLGS
jgi:hypothetical protein